MAASSSDTLALPAPHIDVDALPYVDSQYNDPDMKARVDALIQEEMQGFKPARDYLEPWPLHEPTFESNPLLQAEWIRVCSEAPMSKLDLSRYQLDAPPKAQQSDPAAWQRAVDNAKAQLENQATRMGNLELLQQHGAKLWVAHCNQLEASTKRLERDERALAQDIDAINRKRKADQLGAAPTLARLEGEWVRGVKKNLEIEAQCLRLEAECASLKDAVEAKRRGQ